ERGKQSAARRDPAAQQGACGDAAGTRLRGVSEIEGAPQPAGRHHVRRRATDAGGRTRSDERSKTPDAGRTVARARARGRGVHVRDFWTAAWGRADDPACRAVDRTGAGSLGLCDGVAGWQERLVWHRRGAGPGSAGAESLSRDRVRGECRMGRAKRNPSLLPRRRLIGFAALYPSCELTFALA